VSGRVVDFGLGLLLVAKRKGIPPASVAERRRAMAMASLAMLLLAMLIAGFWLRSNGGGL